MSISKYIKRGLVVLGLVAVAATASASQASAFGNHFGGGHFGGGFGGGHFGGGHFGGMGHQGFFKPFGGFKSKHLMIITEPKLGPHALPFAHFPKVPAQTVCFPGKSCGKGLILPIKPVVNSCLFSSNPMCHPAKKPCQLTNSCVGPIGPLGPVGPVACRFGRCFPIVPPLVVQPVVIPQPVYPQPIYPRPVYRPAYQAAAPSYAPAPAAYSAPAPAIQQPTTVSVLFQPTATSADITNFVKSYGVAVSSGPDANGVYRLQISAGPVSQDQLNQVVQSMRSQTAVVAQVGA